MSYIDHKKYKASNMPSQQETAKFEHELRKSIYLDSFYEFVLASWPIINPSMPLTTGWHIKMIADSLQALYEGKLNKKRLVISVPPRSLKTTITSICFPCWIWLHNPSESILSIAGSDRILSSTSVASHDLLSSSWFKSTFDISWAFNKKQDNNNIFQNTKKGTRTSITITGSIQGAGGNVLILDDITQSNIVNSNVSLDEINRLYQTIASRMNDPKKAIIVLIAQRNHEKDLTGHVLAEEGTLWQHLCLPMEYDLNRKAILYDREGKKLIEDPRTHDKELLLSDRWGIKEIEALRNGVGGSAYFSTQYNQLPVDSRGELFKKEFVSLYSNTALNYQTFSRIFISCDPAFHKGEKNDPCGLQVWGETDTDGYWLLECATEKLSYTEVEDKIKVLYASYPKTSKIIIEKNAHGDVLVQRLQETTNLPVCPVYKDKDKVFYANQHSVPLWEIKKIKLPDFKPWTNNLINEICAFPNGTHDDNIDCMSQCLNAFAESNGKPVVIPQALLNMLGSGRGIGAGLGLGYR
jgi:predicted phage terminase large subunit-like protein